MENTSFEVIVRGKAVEFRQLVHAGRHEFEVDEPVEVGGQNSAPTPYEYILAALGACTSMTVGLYARRKKWPLTNITVSLRHHRIHAKDCADCETKEGMLDQIEIHLELAGDLTPEQHSRLMEIAAKCPVHRTLVSEIKIRLHSVESL